MAAARRQTAIRVLLLWIVAVLLGIPLRWAHFGGGAARDETADPVALRQKLVVLEKQNEGLRAQLGVAAAKIPALGGFRRMTAQMLPIPDPTPGRRSAVIPLGKRDGVHSGWGVLSLHGVVGQIAEVYEEFSRVLLADDPEFRVLYEVQGGSGRGIAAGGPGRDVLSTLYSDEEVDAPPGTSVITAGGDGIFPRGLLIGTVAKGSRSGPSRFRSSCTLEAERAVAVLVPPLGDQEEDAHP